MRRWLIAMLLVGLSSAPLRAEYNVFLPTPLKDMDSKSIPIERFKGKVAVLVVSDRATSEDAYRLGRELRLTFDRGVVFVPVISLQAVPSFVRDSVISDIKDRVRLEETVVKERLAKAGKTLSADSLAPVILPDWDGRLALALFQHSPLPEFASFKQDTAALSKFDRARIEREQQQLRNHLHIFVVDRNGQIKAHYLDASSTTLAISAIRKTLEETP